MNEQLAALLAERLLAPPGGGAPLPFLDRVVGLTRPRTQLVANGEEPRRVTLPVPVSFTQADCDTDPRYLVPDLSTASILFFEDGGTVAKQLALNLQGWESALRLVLWLNPARLTVPVNEAALVNALDRALGLGQRRTLGPFRDLLSTYSLPAAGPALLSAYTLDDTPLLYAPYTLVAVDIRATYHLTAECYTAPLPALKPLDACLTSY